MTAKRSAEPVYVWPEYPDDPTLGGAITAEMHAELQASGTLEGVPDDKTG